MKKILFLSLFLMVCTILSAQKRVKVACVGNSITYGYTLPNPATAFQGTEDPQSSDPDRWVRCGIH